jgi:probable phosphoglycerate mutase
MPNLLLIRHGANDYSERGILAGRRRGVHLNERGREQAQALAEALQRLPIKAVYSSPLERAVETAEPLAAALHLKVVRESGLMESDVGAWEGKAIRQLSRIKYWAVVQRAPSRAGHPGGETFLETQLRIVSALDAICARHKAQEMIACVLHSDPIKLAVAHYLGLPLDHFQRLACEPTSVTMLMLGPSGARLIWLNRQPPFLVDQDGGKNRKGKPSRKRPRR